MLLPSRTPTQINLDCGMVVELFTFIGTGSDLT